MRDGPPTGSGISLWPSGQKYRSMFYRAEIGVLRNAVAAEA